MAKQAETKLTHEQFTRQAILVLRKDGFRGIHTVYSGFNDAFRKYFGEDPVVATKALADAGRIVLRIARGGATIYVPEDAPKQEVVTDALNKILGAGDAKKK